MKHKNKFNHPDDVPFSYHLKRFLIAFFGIPVLLILTAWGSPYLFDWMDTVNQMWVGIGTIVIISTAFLYFKLKP